jgi:hypothetical protein
MTGGILYRLGGRGTTAVGSPGARPAKTGHRRQVSQQVRPSVAAKPLDAWYLPDFVAVAADLGLVKPETNRQAQLAQEVEGHGRSR